MTKQLSKNAVIEATAGAIPAVLLSAMPQQPVIPQKETGMSKVWPFLAGVLPGDLPAVFLPGCLLLYALRLAPGHGRGLRRSELRGHLLPYSGGRHVQHLLPQL